MIQITSRGSVYALHSTPDELTPDEYKTMLFLSAAERSGIISFEDVKVKMLSALMGLNYDYTMLVPDAVAEITAQADAVLAGLLTIIDGCPTINLNTPRNLLPEYEGHKGPADWLSDVTFGDFVACATVMSVLGNEPEEAEQIARRLYHYAPQEAVPDILTTHCVIFFSTVLAEITKAPIDVNGRKIDFAIIFKGDGTHKPDDQTGWNGILLEVAQAGLFGPVAQVEAARFWDVLLYLYKCKFEYNQDRRKQ